MIKKMYQMPVRLVIAGLLLLTFFGSVAVAADIISLDIRVVTGSDDAEEFTPPSSSAGKVILSSSDLELGDNGSDNQDVGIRFQDIEIPQGSAISSAYIQFQADETNSGDTNLAIYGEAIDDAPAFTTATNNITSRTLTTVSVAWSPLAWDTVGEAGPDQMTPDITPVIQEIINRDGWASGNSLVIIITGTGQRTAESYNGDAAGAPLLHIEYTGDPSVNQPPAVDAGSDAFVVLADSVSLDGTVSDDGLPDGTLVTTWTQVSGPGVVVFGDAGAVDTTAIFADIGTYLLRLTADDGEFQVSDDVIVSVIDTSGDVIRFAVIGDYGYDSNPASSDVANLVKSWNPDIIITTGDNNNPVGATSTIDQNIGQYYSDFIYPYEGVYGPGATTNRFFPILGDNDWVTDGATPYFGYFTLPGNERYYDFTWGPVHFFVIDSDPSESDGVDSTSVQATWLQDRLAASSAPWKLVLAHHPPYSSGERVSDWMRWPFQEWGATAVLSGHNHIYERIVLDEFVYFLNGLGGHSIHSIGSPIPGSEVRYNSDYGAMLVEATTDSITFQFFNRTGALIDTYTINNTPNEPPVADPSGPYSGEVGSPISFDGSGSSDQDGTIVSYDWDFGDGGMGTGVSPSYTYAASGVYTVTLTVTDNDGLTDTSATTAEASAQVNEPPVVETSYTIPYVAYLDGTISDDGLPDGSVSVTWSIVSGPGTVTFEDANSEDTMATFSVPGTYVLRLTADDGELQESQDVTIIID
ncbi:MAG: PKD domain-containing protein [Dehalococcoidales bacterium]|nr:MAG: PKD domain-containing protein [Dehalococcoidales bacterium]